MDPCARAEKRGALTCIKGVSTIPLYVWNPRGIFRGIGTDLFIARSSGNSRAEYTAVQFAEPKVTLARGGTLIKGRWRGESKDRRRFYALRYLCPSRQSIS